MNSLEDALEAYSNHTEEGEKLNETYKSTKRYLEDDYYPWIQANCSHFTDHGRHHIQAVIHQASELLKRELDDPESGSLDELDIYLLLSSIIWHDVGMVINRAEHERVVREITEEVKEMAFPNMGIRGIVENIVRGHRKEDGLSIPKKEEICSLNARNFKVYPRTLSAILRFTDEVSETQGRVSGSPTVVDSVPEESKIYWKYAESIKGVQIEPHRSRVISSIEISDDEAVVEYPCPTDLHSRVSGDEISLIEYIVCRLEKMNNERAYCAPEFRRYADIRKIEVRFEMLDENRDQIVRMTEVLGDSGLSQAEEYPNIPLFTEFFDRHENLKPEKIQERCG